MTRSAWLVVRRWLARVWDRVTRPYVSTRRHEAAVALLQHEIRYLRGMQGVLRQMLANADARTLAATSERDSAVAAAEAERDALVEQAAELTRAVRDQRDGTLPALRATDGPALHLYWDDGPVVDSLVLGAGDFAALLAGEDAFQAAMAVIDGNQRALPAGAPA